MCFFPLHKIWQTIFKVMCCICFQFWELIFVHHSHMLTSLFCSPDLGLCSCLMINRADLPHFLFLFYWNFICSVSGFHFMVHSGIILWFWKLSFWMPSLLMSLFLSSSKKKYILLYDVTVTCIMKTPLWLQQDVFQSVQQTVPEVWGQGTDQSWSHIATWKLGRFGKPSRNHLRLMKKLTQGLDNDPLLG